MKDSTFRTIEISNPQFESPYIRFITVKTPNLKGRGDICVFVPPGIELQSNVPIVLLLHGVYGSCWSWVYQGGVHLEALKLIEDAKIPPMIIAMPSDGLWGDGSGYLQHSNSDFERWIVDDVPNALGQTIPGIGEGSPVFIGGLSMGGFGALRIGAKYPMKFKGISTHSSITSLDQMSLFVEEELTHYQQQNPENEDVLKTMLANKEQLPAIRFDCGDTDLLIDHNRTLHQQLITHGIPHLYEEFPGKHEWAYWNKHISKTLQFFASLL